MRIKKLILQSPNIESQFQFYANKLGFTLAKRTSNSIHYQMGKTEFIFEEKEAAKPYHFAFNIPSNNINEALIWLKRRVKILTSDGGEIQNFETWNVKAIYCYDADGNIIEFISRDEIGEEMSGSFSAESIVSVSEIGIVSENNIEVSNYLTDSFSLPLFKGTKEVLTAIGDNHGLFICMDKTKRDWFPISEEAFCSDFKVEFMEMDKLIHLSYQNRQLKYS